MRINTLISCAAMALGVLMAGCSHYHEPAAGDANAVVLRASAGATIVALDDMHVDSGDVMNNAEQTVRAVAGTRTAHIFTQGGKGSGEWSIPLTLEAGHTYRFARASTTALSLSATDETTDQPASSQSKSKAAPVDPGRAMIHFRFAPGVQEIDGYPVDLPKFTIGPFPSEVTSIVAPGEHEVIAKSSFQNGGFAAWRFRFLFVGGHTYRFDAGWTTKLKITDETCGVSVTTGN